MRSATLGSLSSLYLFSGSGCRAATTPPRAAAERLARTAPLAGNSLRRWTRRYSSQRDEFYLVKQILSLWERENRALYLDHTCAGVRRTTVATHQTIARCSLSLRERVRARGNG